MEKNKALFTALASYDMSELILSLIVKANLRKNYETDRDQTLTPCLLPHQLPFPFNLPYTLQL